MIKIETPLSNATVAETSDLANNSSKIIKKHAIEDTYLTQLGTDLENFGNEMENSIATSQKKEMTEELSAADDKRDNAFIALKFFILAYLKWAIDEYKPYAQKVWNIIKQHGLGLDRESYEEESALLVSLINDLEKPDIAEAITVLKQEQVVAYLKDAQTCFSTLYHQSLEAEAGKEIVTSATTLKKDALTKLKAVTNYLNAVASANAGVYGTIQAEMAELVNNVNKKIRTRLNR